MTLRVSNFTNRPSEQSTSSGSLSYSSEENSTGTTVHIKAPGSHTNSDFLDEHDDDAYERVEASDLDHEFDSAYHAQNLRSAQYARTASQPAPARRRTAAPLSETSSAGPSAPRRPRGARSGPTSSVVSGEDGPYEYPIRPPPMSSYARGAGYPPPGGYGAYQQPPYGALVHLQSPEGDFANPFSPQRHAQGGYPFPSSPWGQGPPPPGYTGHEVAPYGHQQPGPYGPYPQHYMDPRQLAAMYRYSPTEPAQSKPTTPAPVKAEPVAAPAAPPAPPAPPKIDPETEKKLQEQQDNLAKQLKSLEDMKEKEAANNAKLAELQNVINESKAREQKMKDDAERAAEMALRIAEEVAKAKAEMEGAQKAKEIAAAEAKLKAEVAAIAAAKEKAEKEAAEAAAKAAYEAQVKADADAAIAAQKAKVEAEAAKVKAEADAAVAAAKAEAEAAKAKVPTDKAKPIKFKDALGRKFNFPFELCKTWKGMNDLICQAFAHVEPYGQMVVDGNYDLIGPSGEIILPQIWETVLEPDWTITMHIWPVKEPEPQRAPSGQPMHGHTRPGIKGAKAPGRRDGPPPPPPAPSGAQPGGPGWIGPLPVGPEIVKPKKKKAQASGWSLFGPPKKSSKGWVLDFLTS